MQKQFSRVRIKNAELGQAEAVFSTFGVIDKDGDVTLKGAFTDGQAVVISAYGHGSWEGRLPVGKGVIRQTDTEAICDMEFFLNTTDGADTWEVVKSLSDDDLQEWSYSLHDVQAKRGTHDGKAVRFLERVNLVKEVSPVLMGAGTNTRTLSTKGTKQLDESIRSLLRSAGRARWSDAYWVYVEAYDVDEEFAVFCVADSYESERLVRVDFTRTDTSVTLGESEVEVIETEVYLPKSAGRLPFSEHAASVVAAVDALNARASEVMALRAEKGKQISAVSAGLLGHLAERLANTKALTEQPTPDTTNDEAMAEFARFVAISQGV